MNFVGYVQLRRGIMDHLVDGRLSNNEALVLMWLIMLADKATGKGTINAPTLRTFLPELSYHAAKRLLQSLEDKQYIFRQIKPFSKVVYPYWVNRYILTYGPHKLLQIDLSQVFESRDIADICYIDPALENAPEGAPEGALDPALYYKNRETKKETKECSNIGTSVNDSVCNPVVETKPITKTALAERTSVQGCALPCAPHVNNTPSFAVPDICDAIDKSDVVPADQAAQQKLATLLAQRQRWIKTRGEEAAACKDVAWVDKFIAKIDAELTEIQK